ncbi:MAG: zinc-finger domain-containing protein [Verrucomicrobiota bacterium]
MSGTDSRSDNARQVELTDKDLPLHCPMPGAPLWARHPRVFLDVTKHGEALCPLLRGTKYTYKGSKKSH